MKAKLWARNADIVFPDTYCCNCGDAGTTYIQVTSMGGLAHGAPRGTSVASAVVIGVLKDLATAGKFVRAVPYCGACAKIAHLPPTSRFWQRRPPLRSGQTSKGRGFAILNEGRDLLHLGKEFVQIEYSNPRFLNDIRRLNPPLRITQGWLNRLWK